MNDAVPAAHNPMADPQQPLDPATRLELHLEALRARMDPGRYEAFERLVAGTAQAVRETANGRPEAVVDLPDEEAAQFGPDLIGELLTVVSILTGHDQDARVVQLVDGVAAVMDADAAEDPALLAEACASIGRFLAQREHETEQLEGIARASSLDEGG